MITTVEEYVASVNAEGREWLTEFYAYMKENHGHIAPVMFRQRPMFKVGKSYVMFTAAAHHFSVHTMNFELIEEYKNKHPGSGNAKGCLNIRYTNPAAKPILKELCKQVIDINCGENAPAPGKQSEMTYEEHLQKSFSLSKAGWRILYENLRDLAVKKLPEFIEYFPASGILWKHTSTFAGITCKKDAMLVEFYADRLHEDRAPVKSLKLSANRVSHTVEITNAETFDLLMQWILESYLLTKKG